MFIEKEEIENKLAELWKAKKTIERLANDEVNCGLFLVRTRQAKEILVNRASEIITDILKKIQEICTDNIKNIRKSYEERQKKLLP